MRVLARDHEGVDDGWLCDRGRFGYQAVHSDARIVEPLVREGTELMPASWEKALTAASGALKKAGARTAALADGETTNEEAFLLQRLFREGLGSGHLASRPHGELPLDVARGLASPALQASIPDLEYAHAVLLVDCDPVDEAPTLDLRIRKGLRRHHVKLGVISARPTALDAHADVVVRHAPGDARVVLAGLDEGRGVIANWLQDAGEDVVVVYGERALAGGGARALLNLASRLGLGRPGAGLIEVPAVANARGIREAGFAPGHGPGYATLGEPGRDARAIAEGLAAADIATVWLNYADPLRFHPDRALWERGLGTAQTVIAVDTVLTETASRFADVVFPGEAYPEKEGTVTNLDGRVQRLRPAIGRARGRSGQPGSGVRPGWQVIGEVARRCGLDLGALTGAMASKQLFEAVPFYAGLTLDELGGRGVRWPELHQDWGAIAEPAPVEPSRPVAPTGDRMLRLGTFRSLWADKSVDASPLLHFLRAKQVVELSPEDAERLGIREGDRVEVGHNGTRVRGAVKLRAAVPAGSVFLAEGVVDEPANALTEALVQVHRVGGPATAEPSAVPVQVAPAVEGLAEMPPSAPLPLPPREAHE
jgi:NADH-quinone oxidoreductase subunit G